MNSTDRQVPQLVRLSNERHALLPVLDCDSIVDDAFSTDCLLRPSDFECVVVAVVLLVAEVVVVHGVSQHLMQDFVAFVLYSTIVDDE